MLHYKFPRILLKAVAVFVIQAFILSGAAFAVPTTATTDEGFKLEKQKEVISDPEKIIIPREAGLIKSKFAGKGGKLIVHIQDAHCNFEAQSNIAKIIETLVKNYNLSFVAVEGADGIVDTSWFKAFPDEDVRKEVATYFMKKGEITGPEFLSITTNYPIKLFGAETRAYYIENLNAFTSSYPLKDQTEKYYNNIKSALTKLKTYIYNDELKSLDQKMADYEEKKLQFNDYVRTLQALAEKHKINLREYENFFKLVNTLLYEKKINFDVVDKERSLLIDELSKGMPKEALKDLVEKSILFKTNKISSAEYYDYIKALSTKNGIDLAKKYPNLANYIIYNSVYSKIENEGLFKEIKNLEIAIKSKLFQNDDQRTLEKLSRHIDTLIGLVNIKLLNDDFTYYKTHRDEFTHEYFVTFIDKKAKQFGLAMEVEAPSEAVANAIPKLEEFYKVAIKRDNALVENTLKQMGTEKQEIGVLVTGGFHSEGIAKLLEKEGVSYAVVCPAITKDVPTPYIQILTNQRTSFEDILVSAADTKKGMLAALVISEVVDKSDQDVRNLFSVAAKKDAEGNVDPAIAALIDKIIERKNNVNPNWVIRSVYRWVQKAIATSAQKGFYNDEPTLKLAYADATRQMLINDLKERTGVKILTDQQYADIDKLMAWTASSSDLNAVFHNIYMRARAPYIEQIAANTREQIFAEAAKKDKGLFSQEQFNIVRASLLKAGLKDIAEKLDRLTGLINESDINIERQLASEPDNATRSILLLAFKVPSSSEGVGRITQAQAYASPEMFNMYIAQQVEAAGVAIPGLEAMMNTYNQMPSGTKAEQDAKKAYAKEIDSLVRNNFNFNEAQKAVGTELSKLTPENVMKDIPVAGNPSAPENAKYLAQAQAYQREAAIGKLDLFAGASSRLFGGTQTRDVTLSYAGHDVYTVAESYGQKMGELIAQGAKPGTSMLTRLMVQEQLNIEDNLRKYYKSRNEARTPQQIAEERKRIVSQTPRVVVVNPESGRSIIEEFVKNGFYGHNPNLIVFTVQGSYRGYDLKNGFPMLSFESTVFPAGHGDATMRLVQPKVFTVTAEGKVIEIKNNPVEHLMDITRGRTKIFVESRVNDMIKLKNEADTDNAVLVNALRQIDEGKNVVFELVEQSKKDPIPGSYPLLINGKVIMVEGLAQSDEMAKMFTSKGALLNRFNIFYTPEALTRVIKEQGLPVYLRFRDGKLYAETVTSDITMLPEINAGVVAAKGRVIDDYKEAKNLANGLNAALGQDKNPDFVKEVAAVQKNDVKVAGLENAPGFESTATKTELPGGIGGLAPSAGGLAAGRPPIDAGRPIVTPAAPASAEAPGVVDDARFAAVMKELNGKVLESDRPKYRRIWNEILKTQDNSLVGYLNEKAYNQPFRGKILLFSIDTGLAPQHVLRPGEEAQSKYLGDRMIEVHGTGEKLIRETNRILQELRDKGIDIDRDVVRISAATDETVNVMDRATGELAMMVKNMGKTLDVHIESDGNTKSAAPIVALREFAMRYANNDLDGAIAIMSAVAKFNPDEMQEFLKDPSKRKAIVTPIKKLNINEDMGAYEAMVFASGKSL